MEMIQCHLSKGLCSTYAMESMIYMTAGLLDEFSSPDVALESAITKYYTLNHLLQMVYMPLSIIGGKSLHANQWSELAFRNATQLYTHGETIDSLRIYIALSGLQHAGVSRNFIIKKLH